MTSRQVAPERGDGDGHGHPLTVPYPSEGAGSPAQLPRRGNRGLQQGVPATASSSEAAQLSAQSSQGPQSQPHTLDNGRTTSTDLGRREDSVIWDSTPEQLRFSEALYTVIIDRGRMEQELSRLRENSREDNETIDALKGEKKRADNAEEEIRNLRASNDRLMRKLNNVKEEVRRLRQLLTQVDDMSARLGQYLTQARAARSRFRLRLTDTDIDMEGEAS